MPKLRESCSPLIQDPTWRYDLSGREYFREKRRAGVINENAICKVALANWLANSDGTLPSPRFSFISPFFSPLFPPPSSICLTQRVATALSCFTFSPLTRQEFLFTLFAHFADGRIRERYLPRVSYDKSYSVPRMVTFYRVVQRMLSITGTFDPLFFTLLP